MCASTRTNASTRAVSQIPQPAPKISFLFALRGPRSLKAPPLAWRLRILILSACVSLRVCTCLSSNLHKHLRDLHGLHHHRGAAMPKQVPAITIMCENMAVERRGEACACPESCMALLVLLFLHTHTCQEGLEKVASQNSLRLDQFFFLFPAGHKKDVS